MTKNILILVATAFFSFIATVAVYLTHRVTGLTAEYWKGKIFQNNVRVIASSKILIYEIEEKKWNEMRKKIFFFIVWKILNKKKEENEKETIPLLPQKTSKFFSSLKMAWNQ